MDQLHFEYKGRLVAVPQTIAEAEKHGWVWLARFSGWCEDCSEHDYDDKSIATYGYGKPDKGCFSYGYIRQYCEDCGKMQGKDQ